MWVKAQLVREFLADVGAVFLLASGICVVGGYVKFPKSRREPSWDDFFRAVGIGGSIVWFLIGFGIAAWLVSFPYHLLMRAFGVE